MILYKKYPLRFEEKDYEIRVLYQDTLINVAAFLNNHPVSGLRHQAMIPKAFDIKAILERGADKELVEMSKKDIVEKRWEKFLKIMHDSKKTG
ncbi:MAG TPA: hypothetical protein VM123_12905 [archaeon]|nr:hypothetical protein [archaeon]